jgi:hypothetical protein
MHRLIPTSVALTLAAACGAAGVSSTAAADRAPSEDQVQRWTCGHLGSSCLDAPWEAESPRLALEVQPRRLRAGGARTVRVRVLVREGSQRRRAANARVTVAGRTTRTNRRGVARLRISFAHPGRRRVVARAPGARRAVGRLVVRASGR